MSARQSPIKATTLDADPRLRQVRALLRRVERRFRLQEIASLVPVALALSLAAIVVSAGLRRFSGALSLNTFLFAGAGLVVFALIIVAVYALLKPRDLLSTARRADLLLGLDERLSTALEDAATPPARPTPA